MSATELAEEFLKAVDEVAADLESEHGLKRGGTRMTGAAGASVAFDGHGMVLVLGCDRGEIDAWMTRSGGGGIQFQLSLVLGLAGVDGWRTRWPRIIGSDTADRSVSMLVGDVLRYAGPWVRNEPDAMRRLEEFREVDLALKMAQFGPGRRSGDQWNEVRDAWDRQDLGRLVRSLDALPAPLRPVEEQARQYALRWDPSGPPAAPAP